MKKKIIALVMSIVLCFSLAVPAFAADDESGLGLDLDISSILSSDIVQELLSSDGVVDLTSILLELITTMNPENLTAMGQEKFQQLVGSMVESVSDFISLLVGNKDLVFTYDPIKVAGNLFDLDTEALTPTTPETTHPDEMVIGMGDVDGDGQVTAADARLILRRAAKLIKFTMEQDALADVDHDKKVTAADARKVLRVAAKLETL